MKAQRPEVKPSHHFAGGGIHVRRKEDLPVLLITLRIQKKLFHEGKNWFLWIKKGISEAHVRESYAYLQACVSLSHCIRFCDSPGRMIRHLTQITTWNGIFPWESYYI